MSIMMMSYMGFNLKKGYCIKQSTTLRHNRHKIIIEHLL
jgi:hypothetical protein